MKKLVIFILIVVIVLAAFWVARRPALKLPFAEIFPEGAIGYVGVHGGAAQISDLTESKFWKKLNGIESVKEFARESGLELQDNGETSSSLGTLAVLLGEDAAAACYGSGSKFGRAVIAAVRTDGEGEAILTLVRTALGGKTAGSYREHQLYSFQIPAPIGLEGAYATGGGVNLVAVSKSHSLDLVKAAIDLSAGEGGRPLSADKNFMKLMGKPLYGTGTLVGCACFDMKTLEKEFEDLKTEVAKRIREKNPEAATKLANAGMKQFPWLSWSGYLYRQQGLAGKICMRLDKARLTAEQRALFEDGAGKLELLRLIPRGAIVVSDSYMGDVSAAWKWYKAQVWPPQVTNVFTLCEQRLGIDFERDVLPWLGDEICFQVSEVVTGGLLPLPRAQIMLAVKNRKAAQKTLSSLMERFAQPPSAQTPQKWAFLRPEIREEEYKGEKIKTLVYPIPGISPSFTFRDRCLIVGLDRTSVQAIVDVASGAGDSLVSDPKFAEMKKVFPDRLQQVNYVDCERACGAVEGVLWWFLSVKRLTTNSSDDPEKVKELDRLKADLPQIFAALKVFRAFMAASVVEGDVIDQYFALRMKDI